MEDALEVRSTDVVFSDSPLYYGVVALSFGVGAGFAAAAGIPTVAVVLGLTGAWALSRAVLPRPRLRVTERGLVDHSFWFSPGLLEWHEILDLRPSSWGMIDIVLRDERAVLERMSPLARASTFKLQLYGHGPAAIFGWSLDASRRTVADAIEAGMDAHALAALRAGEPD